jgi:hypothetical protein
MNLITVPEEKLESLPKVERLETNYRSRNKAPWNRMHRWIESKIGQKSNDVFSQFKDLVWIPQEFRNLDFYKKFVETNTFYENGEVFYYDDSRNGADNAQPVHKLADRHFRFGVPLYVNPSTNVITLAKKKPKPYKPYAPTSYQLSNSVELKKLDGIWYEITTRQLTSKELKNYNLQNDPIDSSISRRKYLNIR